MKRQPGRLPTVNVMATAKPAKYCNRFALSNVQGLIKVKALNSLSGPVGVGIFNLAGKSIVSKVVPMGKSAFVSNKLSRGMYVVKIKGAGLNEVHRINIGD